MTDREETSTMPDTLSDLVPPDPDAPKEPAAKPKRPTTRAGRKAATAARKAAGASDARPSPTKGTTQPRKASLETRLTGSLVSIGTLVAASGAMIGSGPVQADGLLIVQQSPTVADGLGQVAKNDPRVAAALERMLTVGTYGALIGAVTPLAIGIAANHGFIPGEVAAQMGVEVPVLPEPEPPAQGWAPEPNGPGV